MDALLSILIALPFLFVAALVIVFFDRKPKRMDDVW